MTYDWKLFRLLCVVTLVSTIGACSDEEAQFGDVFVCDGENSVVGDAQAELPVWFEGSDCARFCQAAESLCNRYDGDDWVDYNACRGIGEGVEYLCDHAWNRSACQGRCVSAAGGTCGVAAVYHCASEPTCEQAQRCMEAFTETLWRDGTSYACFDENDACPEEGPLNNYCDATLGLCVAGEPPGPPPAVVGDVSVDVFMNVPTSFELDVSHDSGGPYYCRVTDEVALLGRLVLGLDGDPTSGTFEPALDFMGTTSFDYACYLEDGSIPWSEDARVTFDVISHPDTKRPEVEDLSITVQAGGNGVLTPSPVHPTATVFRYDIPEEGVGAPLHVSTYTQFVDGIGVQSLDTSFTGTDSFSYRAMPVDGGAWSEWAEVTVTVE